MSLGEEARKEIRWESAQAERVERKAELDRIQGRACLEALVSEFLKEVVGPPRCAYTAEVIQEVQGWFKKRVIREHGWRVVLRFNVRPGGYDKEILIILENGFWGFARPEQWGSARFERFSGGLDPGIYRISKKDVLELPNLTIINASIARSCFVSELKVLFKRRGQ